MRHIVTAMSYDDDGVWILNSWGTAWGNEGWALLSWAFLEGENAGDQNFTYAAGITGIGSGPATLEELGTGGSCTTEFKGQTLKATVKKTDDKTKYLFTFDGIAGRQKNNVEAVWTSGLGHDWKRKTDDDIPSGVETLREMKGEDAWYLTNGSVRFKMIFDIPDQGDVSCDVVLSYN